MAKWTNYFKIITPTPTEAQISDGQDLTNQGAYSNFSWYQRLVQGSASRQTRYREFDLMDTDVDIARALDTIAEEMTGNDPRNDDPLLIHMTNEGEDAQDQTGINVMTLKVAVKRWIRIHGWDTKLFNVARMLVKYGDVFFKRDNTTAKWEFISTKNVVAAIVDENDVTKVIAWQIKLDTKKVSAGTGSLSFSGGTNTDTTQYEIVSASKIVRFTLNDEMSESAPFGESVLRSVYRSHKQKQLLEDAIIIYRIQRAPERRVFYIDVGKMPPQRIKQYLEGIKNEIRQKKVPTFQGGTDEVDTVYNPHSMSEDFFFAQRADGKGSKVETLPGGAGLGELADLEYFRERVSLGLRIPTSYYKQGQDGAMFNDGKVGVAYIQELRFALYIMRLQNHLEQTLDIEFKKYLKACDIYIDETDYVIRLPEPSNFGKYRQQEVDATLLSMYGGSEAIPYIAKRFGLKRFLQLTDEEITTNERMLLEEKGLDPDQRDEKTLSTIYGAPDTGEGGMGGPMGGGMGGEPPGMVAGAGDMGGDMGAEGGAPPGGEAGGAPPAAGATPPPV